MQRDQLFVIVWEDRYQACTPTQVGHGYNCDRDCDSAWYATTESHTPSDNQTDTEEGEEYIRGRLEGVSTDTGKKMAS